MRLERYLDLGAAGAPEDERKHVRVLNAFAVVSYALNTPYLLVLAIGLPETLPNVAVQAGAMLGWGSVTALQAVGRRTLARIMSGVVVLCHLVSACVLVGNAAIVWPFLAIGVVYPFLLFPASERRWMAASAGAIMGGVIVCALVFAEQPPRGAADPRVWEALRVSIPFGMAAFPALLGVYHHVLSTQAEEALAAEKARSERLLLNVLPQLIAERLKAQENPIADRFDDVTVLFSDLVNFTKLSEKTSPADLVRMLDELFREFDAEVERLGLEKIKTIGDAYMVAGGIPAPRPDHCEAVVELALAMQRTMARLGGDRYAGLSLRIGVHTGPVVAGVIGSKKFAYDLWGDTVNTASRMESHGVPGRVHVSAAVADRLRGRYALEPRGTIEVKGKGPMDTFLVA